ncbi:AraC family transcriptional regulator [Ruminococcaceae bacterium OttesenSCG-928-L11]|nr:AraC family transcriptional regulator [Ruminococcaceae bacterium OttesenSCG-928-L11]
MEEQYLDLDRIPAYLFSAYRIFEENETHIDRIADFDVLLLALEGELAFREEGRDIRLGPGDWYIQRRGRRQEGLSAASPPTYYFIHFIGDYGDRLAHCIPLAGIFRTDTMKPMLSRLREAEANAASAVEKSACFLSILSMLQRGGQRLHSAKVEEIQSYILRHYRERLRIGELAERFFFTEDYIIRLFRRHMGITPYQYIRKVRLEHAKQLMLSSSQTIAAIAAQTGFPDSVSLHKAFVQDVGVAPGVWRRRH